MKHTIFARRRSWDLFVLCITCSGPAERVGQRGTGTGTLPTYIYLAFKGRYPLEGEAKALESAHGVY
jgi:hypothetical protein